MLLAPVALFKVAIIGRPNVGKSTLVNRIVGHRIAIVDDVPGITRDRTEHWCDWQGKHFILIDTGGLVPNAMHESTAEGHWETRINEHVYAALEEADAVIWVVDGRNALNALDDAVANMLRKLNKPVTLAVNKLDNTEQQIYGTAEFYGLGFGQPFALSALHGAGTGDLLDDVLRHYPEGLDIQDPADSETTSIRFCLMGRPNVGKSSLFNALLGKERAMVSDIAGTTRDPIEMSFVEQGQSFTLLDTAGLRRKSKVEYGVELFSADRALNTMRNSHVTVLVMDATQGVTDQDKRIIELSNDAGCGLVLVFNKWDLIPDKTPGLTANKAKEWLSYVPHGRFAPVLTTSVLEGQRVNKLLSLVEKAYRNNHQRFKTSVVNEVLHEAIRLSPPPPVKNKRLNLLYGTQVSVAPPTFLLFVNDAKLLNDTYKRYLENQLRQNFDLEGTPIILAARGRPEKS